MSMGSMRLTDALLCFEDLCLAQAARVLASPKRNPAEMVAGIICNRRALRRRLLDKASMAGDPDWTMPVYVDEDNPLLYGLGGFHFELHQWMHTSRRIFCLNTSLETYLKNCDYSNLRWDEVSFPFPSFVITLESPFEYKSDDGKKLVLYDSFMVSWTGTHLLIRMFSKKETLGEFTQHERLALEVAFQKHHHHKIAQTLVRWNERRIHEDENVQGVAYCAVYVEGIDPIKVSINSEDLSVRAKRLSVEMPGSIKTMEEGQISSNGMAAYSDAAKIAIGLGLYLKNLSHDEVLRESPMPTKKSQSAIARFISDEAHICDVLMTRVLNPKIFKPDCETGPQSSRKGGYELNPHSRIEYFRRPWGKGKDPHAEKTVKIEAVIVRKDRLPEGAVIIGSRTKVKNST